MDNSKMVSDGKMKFKEGELPPRTFQVAFKKPFGHFTNHAYHFHLHADSHEEALQWVERVFPGIETASLRKRWAEPRPKVPRVGMSTSVSVIDVDAMKSGQDGRWRKTKDEVKEGLEDIFEKLGKEQKDFVNGYPHHVKQYERYPSEHYFNRLIDLRRHVAAIQRWRATLWSAIQEMDASEASMPLPERKANERRNNPDQYEPFQPEKAGGEVAELATEGAESEGEMSISASRPRM